MSETIRVALVDFPGSSRTALAHWLEETPGLELVILEPADHLLLDPVPDVVILDDRLVTRYGRLDGWGAAKVIVVGVDDNPGYAARARRLGASAWIPKERAELLVQAVLGEEASGRRGNRTAMSVHP